MKSIARYVLLVAVLLGLTSMLDAAQPMQERRFNSPEEAAAFIAQLPPGSSIKESKVVTDQAASGTGAGLDTKGQDQKTDFTSTAPAANLPGVGGASGGDSDINADNKGKSGWNSPLVWCGIACALIGGFALYRREVRGATIAFGVGGAFILLAAAGEAIGTAAAWVIGVGGVGLAGFLIYRGVIAASEKADKAKAQASATENKEGLRAALEGVFAMKPDREDYADTPEGIADFENDKEFFERLWKAVEKACVGTDSDVLQKVIKEDRL